MKTLREFWDFLQESQEAFSFQELEKYVGLSQRRHYLESTLPLMGSGSGREVFDLGVNVLKVAVNEIGITQNETEYNLYESSPQQVKEVLAAIREPHDPGFAWILMEKVKPLESEQEFARLLGIGTKEASELFGHICYQIASTKELKQEIQNMIDYAKKVQQISHNPAIRDPEIGRYESMLNFTDDFSKLCLAVPYLEANGGDLGRIEQLGVASSGALVILDYGFGAATHGMFNPTPYQQDRDQRRRDYDEYGDEEHYAEYDKYGNKIVQPVSPERSPQRFTPVRPEEDDDIPF